MPIDYICYYSVKQPLVELDYGGFIKVSNSTASSLKEAEMEVEDQIYEEFFVNKNINFKIPIALEDICFYEIDENGEFDALSPLTDEDFKLKNPLFGTEASNENPCTNQG